MARGPSVGIPEMLEGFCSDQCFDVWMKNEDIKSEKERKAMESGTYCIHGHEDSSECSSPFTING